MDDVFCLENVRRGVFPGGLVLVPVFLHTNYSRWNNSATAGKRSYFGKEVTLAKRAVHVAERPARQLSNSAICGRDSKAQWGSVFNTGPM